VPAAGLVRQREPGGEGGPRALVQGAGRSRDQGTGPEIGRLPGVVRSGRSLDPAHLTHRCALLLFSKQSIDFERCGAVRDRCQDQRPSPRSEHAGRACDLQPDRRADSTMRGDRESGGGRTSPTTLNSNGLARPSASVCASLSSQFSFVEPRAIDHICPNRDDPENTPRPGVGSFASALRIRAYRSVIARLLPHRVVDGSIQHGA
jgi:hypothetical protein